MQNSTHFQQVPKPTISMPNSFSNKPGFYDDADSTVSNNQSGSDKKAVDAKQTKEAQKKPTPNGTNEQKRFDQIIKHPIEF